jgi:hypothetical protein
MDISLQPKMPCAEESTRMGDSTKIKIKALCNQVPQHQAAYCLQTLESIIKAKPTAFPHCFRV